jgi:hypothetical protein
VSPGRILITKRTVILVVLVTLALGLIGTSLSTLYEQNEWTESYIILKVSYGFPMAWHGYSQNYSQNYSQFQLGPPPLVNPPKIYWLSLGSLLLDVAFWFAISFCLCIPTITSMKILLKTTASKTVTTYFLASVSFSFVGLSMWLFSYEDLGLRLFGFGIFLVAATFYQSLASKRKKELLQAL